MSEPSPNPPVDQTPSGTETQTTQTESTTQTTQTTETPPKTILNQDEPKTTDAPQGAPEAYADFKLPDGVALAPETLSKATELFKGLNLPQAAAQSLIDFHLGQMQAIERSADDTYRQTVEGWGEQLKADPEIGGKLGEVKANLGKAYDVIINAVPEKAAEARALVNEFKSVMDLTGAGNHPAFVKFFNRLAQRVIEPSHVSGKGPVSPSGNSKPSTAESMYPGGPITGRPIQ